MSFFAYNRRHLLWYFIYETEIVRTIVVKPVAIIIADNIIIILDNTKMKNNTGLRRPDYVFIKK